MIDLHTIFRAGFVRRWHTNPDLAHTCDRIDGHSARVARIILALHPRPTVEILRAALIHDDGESAVGDIPAPIKTGRLRAELNHAEGRAARAIWSDDMPLMQGSDLAWLHFADRLDAYQWASHHAPQAMHRDGWPEARQKLYAQAIELGCTDAFCNLMRRMEE